MHAVEVAVKHCVFRLFKAFVVVLEDCVDLFVGVQADAPLGVEALLLKRPGLSIFVLQGAGLGGDWLTDVFDVYSRVHACSSLVSGHFLDLRDWYVVEVLHDPLVLLHDDDRRRLVLAELLLRNACLLLLLCACCCRCIRLSPWLAWLEGELSGQARLRGLVGAHLHRMLTVAASCRLLLTALLELRALLQLGK